MAEDTVYSEYDEYVRRREQAGFGRQSESGKGLNSNGRFVPKSERPDSGQGTAYKSSGYAQASEELGQDPLSSVRTLRNTLRKRAARYIGKEETVKSHLCNMACDRLSRAENELLQLNENRSTAIILGQMGKADELKRKMEQVSEDAIRGTYSDLVMDDDEMRAFGVESEWTPSPVAAGVLSSTVPQAAPRSERVPTPQVGSYRRTKTPDERPASTKSVKDVPIPVAIPTQIQTRTSTPQSSIKRNERMFGADAPPPPAQKLYPSGEFSNSPTTCSHCAQSDPSFSTQKGIESHYIRACPMMTRCHSCSKVIMVPQLHDHQLNRCSALGAKMTQCHRCGRPIDSSDQELGLGHTGCPGTRPPNGSQWCPLCNRAVQDNRMVWHSHLTKECSNNPRMFGAEPEPIALPDFSKLDKTDEEPVVPKTAPIGNGQRLIDADKLVAALQEVQMKKKKKKQDAIAAAKASGDPLPEDITVTETITTTPVQANDTTTSKKK